MCRLLWTDARGYIQPLVQDVLLQTFVELMLTHEVGKLSEKFCGSRAGAVRKGIGDPGCYDPGSRRSSTALIQPSSASGVAPRGAALSGF
jgi:hypothetical protein